jgi:hypothetical protein
MLKSNAQLELGVAGLWAHGSVPLLSNSLVQLSGSMAIVCRLDGGLVARQGSTTT